MNTILLCAMLQVDGPAIPAMTEDQRARLAQANDGGDQHEEAFLALLENVRTWTSATPNAPQPSIELLTDDPAAHRGALFLVTGTLAQMSPLDPPITGVEEWFVRDAQDRPMLVYVLTPEEPAPKFRAGDRVDVIARFYKRVELTARDGKRHSYPAFVGAFPRSAVVTAQDASTSRLWMMAGPVAGLLVIFTVMMLWIRRNRRSGTAAFRMRAARSGSEDSSGAVDSGEPLPDDPAAALAELRRRAAEPNAPTAESHASH